MSTCSRTFGKGSSTIGLMWAGLILGCLVSTVVAAPGQGAKRKPQKASNAQLREGFNVLQATKKILQSADNDYGGHRVDAIKAIDAAEHQLRLALRTQQKGKSASAKPAKSGNGKRKKPEPQSISNLQLADAIVILVRTQELLEKADHDYGGHRDAAVRDIGVAIKQLKTALKYEKKTKG